MLLTSNQITVKSGHEISHFSPTGMVFDDGSRVMADLVIFATGYSKTTIKQVAESLFGPQVADAVHDLGGWDSDCELAGVWRPTGRQYSVDLIARLGDADVLLQTMDSGLQKAISLQHGSTPSPCVADNGEGDGIA
ncbi:hypothetical protein DFJ58DRAFT_730500 [Suillus subalutaceus]|uniref:uncharacterized protein n=1 Tax=Suillus subalutaceus TaxID=48586 RepID=UPI001B863DF5|nr:uncharacterized protein DFJ58DRAFT_730500 [Suillus subalutaceus]KAG1846376.1 hypothetical protein DFJ58DRAFT_730500 [Suillus subalutaceus]